MRYKQPTYTEIPLSEIQADDIVQYKSYSDDEEIERRATFVKHITWHNAPALLCKVKSIHDKWNDVYVDEKKVTKALRPL